MIKPRDLLDRTAVLFIGLFIGFLIGLAFKTQGRPGEALFPDAEESGAPEALASGGPSGGPACASSPLVNARVQAARREGRPIHIGMFGDSFGEGLWAGAYNALPKDEGFEVHRFAKQSTGFTRYKSLNLLDDTTSRIAEQPIDLALISFGANDTQGVFGEDKHVAPYMSPAWQKLIGDRAAAMIRLLQSRGATVVWVGLPIMRDADYNKQIREMNAFYKRKMCELGVRYIDTLSASIDGKGQFSAYLPDAKTGEMFQARANDGIHMSVKGYRRLISGLLEEIRGLGKGPKEEPKKPEQDAKAQKADDKTSDSKSDTKSSEQKSSRKHRDHNEADQSPSTDSAKKHGKSSTKDSNPR